MTQPVLRVFSYLPNPRVWKALIAAEFAGVHLELCGDEPRQLVNWLWDFDARPLEEDEHSESSRHARIGKRGFTQTLYKTDAFLVAHPYGTVPAAFSPDGTLGNAPFLTGDAISLADVAFVCDLAQFLKERRARDLLREAGLPLVTHGEPITHPHAFEHLFRLAETPEFAKHLGGYLDDARSDLAR